MIFNLFQDISLLIFIISSLFILYQKRRESFGLIVKDGDHEILNGKQGVSTIIGRLSSCDVTVNEPCIGRNQAIATYDAAGDSVDLLEFGKKINCENKEYHIGKKVLSFILPKNDTNVCYKYIPIFSSVSFILLQAMKAYKEWQNYSIIGLYCIILAYLLSSFILRVDKVPIIEAVYSIFLTYYIEATLYPALYNNNFQSYVKDAYIGIILYVSLALIINLLLKMDFSYYIYSKTIHEYLRKAATIFILILIIINCIFAKNINGSYNWIQIGSISFQPSELVKILLLFVLVQPNNKLFYDKNNLLYMFGVTSICFTYSLLIRDSGLLLQFAIMFIVAIIIQNTNIVISLLMIATAMFGSKVVIKISSTAAKRFYGWLGTGNSLLKSLTGSGSILNFDTYGYQSVHAMIATFINGGMFGNSSFDVLKGITASNSDLVIALISQKHGYITLFLIIAMYALLIVAVLYNLRQQNRFQQMLTCLAIASIVFAMILNVGGTFSVIPLTGVVLPAMSDGISASISYGCMFGIIASSSINKKYYKKVTNN